MILERNINYKYLGELDVSNISNKIYSNNLDWEDYKFRQERYKDRGKRYQHREEVSRRLRRSPWRQT